jgi:hypothetical protein
MKSSIDWCDFYGNRMRNKNNTQQAKNFHQNHFFDELRLVSTIRRVLFDAPLDDDVDDDDAADDWPTTPLPDVVLRAFDEAEVEDDIVVLDVIAVTVSSARFLTIGVPVCKGGCC